MSYVALLCNLNLVNGGVCFRSRDRECSCIDQMASIEAGTAFWFIIPSL